MGWYRKICTKLQLVCLNPWHGQSRHSESVCIYLCVHVFQKHATVIHYRYVIHNCSELKWTGPTRMLTIACKHQFVLCILPLPSTNAVSHQRVLSTKYTIPNYTSCRKLLLYSPSLPMVALIRFINSLVIS